MVCKSLHILSSWYSAAVSAIPGLSCTSSGGSPHCRACLCLLRTCTFRRRAASSGVPCLHSRVGKTCVSILCDDSDVFDGVHHWCCSPVLSQCPVITLEVLRIKLHLASALGEWASICGDVSRFFLSRDDLLCLRETARFHATCEWFGPSWTVALSPLVHVVRRPAWLDF